MLSVLRNFAITFFVSLLIFGLLSLMICKFVTSSFGDVGAADTGTDTGDATDDTNDPENPGTGSDVTTSPVNDFDNIKGTSFNILLVGTDYQPDVFDDYDLSEINSKISGFPIEERKITADMIILLRVDKKTGEFVFCPLPSNLHILIEGLNMKLGDLYAEKGIEALCGKVTALTSLPMDYYAVVSIPGFANIIDELGGITYFVSKDMNYEDPSEGLVINLKRGSQKLDGQKALMLLRYNSYSDNGKARRETNLNFMKALLTKFASSEYYDNASEYFNKLLQYTETNFSEQDLAANIDLIFAYSEFRLTDIDYPGSTKIIDEVTYYEPAIQDAWSLFKKYKFAG